MKLIPNAVSIRVARSALLGSQNAPSMLFAVGVVGVTCSTVLACRATLKLSDTLEEAKSDLAIANSLEYDEGHEGERKRDVATIYVRSIVRVGTLYAPAVIIGGASIAALTKSHSILTQRNAAMMAAYAALERGFGDYRSRVIDKYGENQDREFRYATEKVEITDEKTGKKKKVKQAALSNHGSVYARFFDQTCDSWNKEAYYNFEFLKCQQNYANDLLRSRGHIFLNEIYDILGLERSMAGQVVGWVWNNPEGDKYIDFGCFGPDEGFTDFALRQDQGILLDFNVDGVVYDKLPQLRGVNEINEVIPTDV